MSFEELSPEMVELLRKQSPSTASLSMGVTFIDAATNEIVHPLDVRPVPEMFDCEFCGHCENPNNCVWGVICPVCQVGPREQCIEPFDKRVVGLHAERWQLAAS